jgi:hypothetical protein
MLLASLVIPLRYYSISKHLLLLGNQSENKLTTQRLQRKIENISNFHKIVNFCNNKIANSLNKIFCKEKICKLSQNSQLLIYLKD